MLSSPSHIAIEVRRLERPVRFEWDSATPSLASSEMDRGEWDRIVLANPRVYDGPMIFVSRLDDDGTLHCRAGSYREFVIAQSVGRAVEALGVSGLVRYKTPEGRFLTLIGRRGNQTRIYGGAWETAPRGTLSPPPLGVQVTLRTLESQLQQEFAEEVGAEIATAAMTPFALVRDPNAKSLDVLFVLSVDRAAYDHIENAIRKGGNWEYSQLRWVDLEKDAELLLQDFSPPTAALVHAMQTWS